MLETEQVNWSPLYDERPWGSFTVLDEGVGYIRGTQLMAPPALRRGTRQPRRSYLCDKHWFDPFGDYL